MDRNRWCPENSKNTYIIFNRISNVLGLHANGIGMYDIHGVLAERLYQ